MTDIATFKKGGVHPPERKTATRESSVQNASLPAIATIPLHQHIGSPAECVVAKGDKVREGMLIGRAVGFVSTAVHSSIPGTVTQIAEVALPNGSKSQAVMIELEGEFDRLGKQVEPEEWRTKSAKDLLNTLQERGVVGLGGATFPTHVKFSIPKGSRAELFVANGVECEPFLSADHRLMLEKTKQILEGIEIVRSILEPDRVVIAVEANKPDAIEILESETRSADLDIEVISLQVKYPQGDEKQILKAITGREVPSGGLPLAIGAVVSNVSTIHAIYEAVVFSKPVIERILTVSGGAVRTPGNYKTRVGTPIGQLIEECGGLTEVPERIVVGGPMMGFTALDLDAPVTKGTSGILALKSREIKKASRTPCIGCGSCVSVCPLGLNPTRLFKLVDHLELEQAVEDGLMDCKECGCCSYSCPARIPLVQGMRLGKQLHIRNTRRS